MTGVTQGQSSRGARRWRRGLVSLSNQAIASLTSLLLTLVALRLLSPEQFAAFSIAFAAHLLVIGLGGAAWVTPLIIDLPEVRRSQRWRRARSALRKLLFLARWPALLLGALLGLGLKFWPAAADHLYLLLACALCSLAGLLKTLITRFAFSAGADGFALSGNLLTLLAVALLLPAVQWWGPSAATLLGALALALLLGTAYSAQRLRLLGAAPALPTSGHAHERRASVMGAGVTWTQGQVHTYLCALLLGPIAVAQLSAARLFAMPLQLALPAINQLRLPGMAEARVRRPEALPGMADQHARRVAVLGLGYAGLLLLLPLPLIGWIVGARYEAQDLAMLLPAWGAVVGLMMVRDAYTVALQAQKRFAHLLRLNIGGAALTLLACALLGWSLGPLGVLLGMMLGECMMLVLGRSMVRRHHA